MSKEGWPLSTPSLLKTLESKRRSEQATITASDDSKGRLKALSRSEMSFPSSCSPALKPWASN